MNEEQITALRSFVERRIRDYREAVDKTSGGEWYYNETLDDSPLVCVKHPSVSGAARVLAESDWGTKDDFLHIILNRPDHVIRWANILNHLAAKAGEEDLRMLALIWDEHPEFQRLWISNAGL